MRHLREIARRRERLVVSHWPGCAPKHEPRHKRSRSWRRRPLKKNGTMAAAAMNGRSNRYSVTFREPRSEISTTNRMMRLGIKTMPPPREADVLRLIAAGSSNREIARAMPIPTATSNGYEGRRLPRSTNGSRLRPHAIDTGGVVGTGDMTVRVGVIGAEIMGADHVRTVEPSVIGATVTMIADVELARAEEAAGLAPHATATREATEVIANQDVDAVIIASHDSTHADLTVAALRAGKPVMCEKPLAPTVAECARVVHEEDAALAGQHRAPLVSVGFMRRFDPGYREMKAAIAAGVCGAPLMIHCFSRGVRSVAGATTEFGITNSAVHEFDIVSWLL